MKDQGRCIFGMGACVWQCLLQQAVFFFGEWWFFRFYGFWVKNYSPCKAAVLLFLRLWAQEQASAAKRWWDFVTPSASAGKALLQILIVQALQQEMLRK